MKPERRPLTPARRRALSTGQLLLLAGLDRVGPCPLGGINPARDGLFVRGLIRLDTVPPAAPHRVEANPRRRLPFTPAELDKMRRLFRDATGAVFSVTAAGRRALAEALAARK